MRSNPWQQRAERAEQLASQIPAAAQVLRFYVPIVRFQEELYRWLTAVSLPAASLSFKEALEPSLTSQFRTLLAVAEGHGPDVIANTARELQEEDDDSHSILLHTFWTGGNGAPPETGAQYFLARAFLQPYAEFIRSKIGQALCRTLLISVRCAIANRVWAFYARWAMAANVSCFAHFASTNGSSAGLSAQDAEKKITPNSPSIAPRNFLTCAWNVVMRARPISRPRT